MPPHPNLIEPNPIAPEGESEGEGDTQYYRRILHEMIDLGADLARHVHQQAKAQPEPAPSHASNDNRSPTADYTAAFDRIVRAIRRTILLARSLDAPPRPQPAVQDRTAARKRILRVVENSIHSDASKADAESLHAELLDRLDSPEFEHDLATRPIAGIIDDIRADLGLDSIAGYKPWKRRTPADLVLLHARAAAPHRPAPPWPPPAPARPAR